LCLTAVQFPRGHVGLLLAIACPKRHGLDHWHGRRQERQPHTGRERQADFGDHGRLARRRHDADGNFQFNAIQAGSYKISIAHPGFKGYEKKNIQLTPNENLSAGAIRLELGDVSESVTVRADGAAVQIASGERPA